MSRPDVRVPREVDHPWHVALNQYEAPFELSSGDVIGRAKGPAFEGKHFMYEAKRMAEEVPRLALLFGMERRGELTQRHHQCSHDAEGEAVVDNHLTCCLGVECRACPHLAAIERVTTTHRYERDGEKADGRPNIRQIDEPITPETRDVIKAWTCATHIAMSGGDTANEGYILTTDDRMYWSNVYASLADTPENP